MTFEILVSQQPLCGDLHLHPKWQQRVLIDLLKTFPNTQFIVTTHLAQTVTVPKQGEYEIMGVEQRPPTNEL